MLGGVGGQEGNRKECSFPNGINAWEDRQARRQGPERRLSGQVAGRARSTTVVSAMDPRPRFCYSNSAPPFTGRPKPRAA